MNDLRNPYSAPLKQSKSEALSSSEELHHIAELLEEMILLFKGNTDQKECITAASSPKNDEVMTVKEAAELLRISLPKMYEFARSGRIRMLQVGRRVLISRSSLMALLQEGEHNGNETR